MTSKAKNKIIVLGSGTSTGVPTPACQCEVCLSTDPKDKRMRTSLFLELNSGEKIIVDTGPDLRSQVLANDIREVDYAIITHEHADHLHGIDDLRPFCFGEQLKTIPVFTDEEVIPTLEIRFPYIFNTDKVFGKDKPVIGGGIPRLEAKGVCLNQTTRIGNADFEFFKLPHGHGHTLGFKQGNFAYIIDCHEVTDEVVAKLKDAKLELLIIDCLRPQPHRTHLTLEKSLKYIEQIAPKKAGLIHMAHQFSHQKLSKELKEQFNNKVFATHDGMHLEYS